MDFLIRFVQVHEEFRQAEVEALATVAGVIVQVVSYSSNVRWNFLLQMTFLCCPWSATLRSHMLSNSLFSHHFASSAFLRRHILRLQRRLSFPDLSLPKRFMNCGVSELAMMNCTKTVQLEAKLSGPFTGRRASNSLSTPTVESEQAQSSATSSTLSAILASKVPSLCMVPRLDSLSLRNGT